MKKRVYISGPISGLDVEVTRKRFQETEDLINSLGLIAVNPMKKDIPDESSWLEHIHKDIDLLVTCDAIYFMDSTSWKNSNGCGVEYYVSKQHGIRQFFNIVLLEIYSKSMVSKEEWFETVNGLIDGSFDMIEKASLMLYGDNKVTEEVVLMEIISSLNRVIEKSKQRYHPSYGLESVNSENFKWLEEYGRRMQGKLEDELSDIYIKLLFYIKNFGYKLNPMNDKEIEELYYECKYQKEKITNMGTIEEQVFDLISSIGHYYRNLGMGELIIYFLKDLEVFCEVNEVDLFWFVKEKLKAVN